MDNESLRKVQLVQLEILKEFKRVCEALNLKYMLDAGTLLGAVRHGGFIPWDDDLDVGMLRADYEKFLAEAPALLDKKYFLQTWRTDPGYGNPFAKLRMNDTIFIEKNTKTLSMHKGIFIDIFPFDFFKPGLVGKFAHLKQCWYIFLFVMKHNCMNRRFENKWAHAFYRFVYYCSGYQFVPREELFKRYERFFTRYKNCNTGWVRPTYFHTFPSSMWESLTPLRFEDDEFLCPTDYDAYLTEAYGDYMTLPPVEKRGNQHGILELKLPGESVSIRFDEEDN